MQASSSPSLPSLQVQSLQDAFRLNNAGVSFLACGDALSGLRCLAQALNTINSFVAQAEAHGVEDSQGGLLCPMATYPLGKFVQNEWFYVYDQALVFQTPQSATNHDDTWLLNCDICVSTAVILFNMALALHQQGAGGTTVESERKLQKAKYMYNESIKLLEASAPEVHPSIGFVLLAAANNVAAIGYQLQDYAASAQQLEQVQTMYVQLISTTMATENHQQESFFNEQHLDEIILNFTTMSRPPTAAPSA